MELETESLITRRGCLGCLLICLATYQKRLFPACGAKARHKVGAGRLHDVHTSRAVRMSFGLALRHNWKAKDMVDV